MQLLSNSHISRGASDELKALGLGYLSTLSQAMRDKLTPLLQFTQYRKGDIWGEPQKPVKTFAIVLEGLIEQVDAANSPHDIRVMNLIGPHETLSLSAYLNHETLNSQIRVSSRTAVFLEARVMARDFRAQMRSSPELLDWALQQLQKNEQLYKDKIYMLSAGRLQTKLVEFFQNLVNRFAKPLVSEHPALPPSHLNSNVIELPFQLTKTQVARVIDARVETVIRALNKWERMGFISFNQEHLQLMNFDQLKNFVSETL
jgi:CRP-like cAMP-binding protein